MSSIYELTATGDRQQLDVLEAKRALLVLADPDHGCQLRAWPTERRLVRPGNDVDALYRAALDLADGARGLYVMLNPVPADLARPARKDDVLRRRWHLIDVDARRPDTSVMATDAEHEAAREFALAVLDHLAGRGWPAPVLIDSGNGFHLNYRVDLPNDEAARALLGNCLKALAARFNGDQAAAAVGTETHYAVVATKLPGSWYKKGPLADDRPYRQVKLLHAPELPQPVPPELLQALAAEAPSPLRGEGTNGNGHHSIMEVTATGEGKAAYGRTVLEQELGKVALTKAGERHRQVYRSACAIGNRLEECGIDRAEAEDALVRMAFLAGLPESEARRAAKDGLLAGSARPKPVPERNGHHANGHALVPANGHLPAVAAKPPAPAFPDPVPISRLRRQDEERKWLWKGYLSRGGITLMSALWKAGKTTLLSHLLKSLETGSGFCGYPTAAAKVLYITEEHESLWAERRDRLGLKDHIECVVQPFLGRPKKDQWQAFLEHLARVQEARRFDLIVLDTIANLWPVKDENDAAGVQDALMPLRGLVRSDAGMMLVHHVRKSDGGEGTAARGSGALSAFVETIVEFRRFKASDRKDCRRVLTGYGRYDETPDEVVVELTADGYQASGGNRSTVSVNDLTAVILGLLPRSAPGLTAEQIADRWPAGGRPQRNELYAALGAGAERGLWHQTGEGRKGSPRTYWLPRLDEEAVA